MPLLLPGMVDVLPWDGGLPVAGANCDDVGLGWTGEIGDMYAD